MGKSIDDYRKKRDFSKTPEPPPGNYVGTPGELVFVVHRHDATHLHYDLRLEMDGVLKSWAVPRGVSYVPQEKRLAVRTEDHPMEYMDFHGVIPKGQYGAGTMEIFDRGRYRLLTGDGPKGVDEGKLEFALEGRRLRGEWHLVRTKRGDGNEWLLFKASDRYAREHDREAQGGDLAEARPAAFPRSIKPMLPGAVVEPFSDPEWLFEMRFDGVRLLAYVDEGEVRLRSPGRKPLEKRLPEIARELGHLHAERAVLDGVLVAVDETGRPSPERLEERLAGDETVPVQYYAFDLLYWDEFDLRRMPLIDRKAQLGAVIPRLGHVLFVDHVAARGERLVAAVEQGGLGGVIAKDSRSVYRAGPSDTWRTIEVDVDADAGDESVRDALGHRGAAPSAEGVRFTNMEKVFWPDEGFTKGDLCNYYDQVADYILPHLAGRPLHMKRLPDGIYGEAFYQRQAPEHTPDWVETVEYLDSDGDTNRHIVCNDRATLLWLANLGSIDLHPWMSRVGSLDLADYTILDLDPKEAPFENVIKVARALGKVLRAIGIRSYLKTSGSTGLHIYIPLADGYTYEQGRMFCEGVARIVAREHKDIATIVRNPGRRGGRVYIDFLQNFRGQTVVPPYVVRPVEGARVSTPLEWSELEAGLDPHEFTMFTVPDRISKVGDLFLGALEDRQDLIEPIANLEAYLRS